MWEDWERASRRITLALCGAHLAGAVFVFMYLSQFAPADNPPHGSILVDLGVFLAYALIAFPATGAWCDRMARRTLCWAVEDRAPEEIERAQTLALPLRMSLATGA